MTEWTKLDTAGKIEVVKQAWRANAPVSAWAPKGVSRGAVLGLYKRNPELRKTHPLNPPGERRQVKPAAARINVDLSPFIRLFAGKSLLSLERRDCRYPVHGEGASTIFCGCRATDGRSYCAHHLEICTGIGTESERRAVKTMEHITEKER